MWSKKTFFHFSFVSLITLVIGGVLLWSPGKSYGDELDDLEGQLQDTRNDIAETQQKLDETKAKLEAAKQQEAYYQGALQTYAGQLEYAKFQLEQTQLELEQKSLELDQTRSKIEESRIEAAYQQQLLENVVREFYITNFMDTVSVFFSRNEGESIAQALTYRKAVADNYRFRLGTITDLLASLEVKEAELDQLKLSLETDREALEAQQASLTAQIANAQYQLVTAQSQQSQLLNSLTGIETELSSLTAKEREILQAKAAAALASTTVGEEEISLAAIEVPPPTDGTYFSFWTYGYPHRVGMNQYGAYGRSKAGQNYQTILNAYFNGVTIANFWDDNDTIPVQGYGNIKMRDYLYGIGEMPESWGDSGGLEALKAQAVAARTYALNYIYYSWNGSSFVPKTPVSICTDQNCQVYTGNPKTGKWKQAVDETAGKVILYNGGPITAWYASTAGGFTLSSQEVWGGVRPWVTGIADLDNLSYPYDGPQHGNSPWYHKAWGNDPWLSPDEVADLFNAALLPESYNDHLPSSGNGGYTPQQVRNALQTEGITPVGSATAVEVLGANSKLSSVVRIYYGSGNAREVDAQRFKFVFNLRSPGTDAIWTGRFDVVSNT